MGPMTNLTCEHWRGVLAMDVLGKLNVAEHAGLLAHLDGCPECREISVELASTCDALALVDTSALAPRDAVSTRLTTGVLGALHRAGRARQRRHTAEVLAGAVSGLVAASLIMLAGLSGHSGGPTSSKRIESLHGIPTVTASVVLTPRVWGTSVDFREHGLAGRSVYVVSMESASGRWWDTGT